MCDYDLREAIEVTGLQLVYARSRWLTTHDVNSCSVHGFGPNVLPPCHIPRSHGTAPPARIFADTSVVDIQEPGQPHCYLGLLVK